MKYYEQALTISPEASREQLFSLILVLAELVDTQDENIMIYEERRRRTEERILELQERINQYIKEMDQVVNQPIIILN